MQTTSFTHGGESNSHYWISSNQGSRGKSKAYIIHALRIVWWVVWSSPPCLPTTNPICTTWYHSPISRIRLQILSLVLFLFALVLATDKLDDKFNIEDLNASFNLIFDGKDFEQLGTIFTPDVTYNSGVDAVQGLPNVISTLSTFIPNTTTTYTTLGTQLIKFRPPFDKEGRSKLAELVSYSIFVNFGGGNLTGQSYIIFARYVDKEIVKTNEPGFDGCRFKNRKFEIVVSFYLCRVASTPPCCSKDFRTLRWS